MVRTRSRVQIPLSAPAKNHKILWFFFIFRGKNHNEGKTGKTVANTIANIFGIFTSVIDFCPEGVNKIFRTVKNALKLPVSGAVANNSKQIFCGIVKQPPHGGCFTIKILFVCFAVHYFHQFVQRGYIVFA